MKLRILILLACVGLVSCKTHFTYRYYEPQGDGVLMSDLAGHVVPGRLEYLQLHLPRCIAYIRCLEKEASRPEVSVTLLKKVRSMPPLVLAEKDFEAVTFDYAKGPAVRLHHSSKIEAQDENRLHANLLVDGLPDAQSSFTMHILPGPLTEHAIDLVFVRKHADYWEYVQLQ